MSKRQKEYKAFTDDYGTDYDGPSTVKMITWFAMENQHRKLITYVGEAFLKSKKSKMVKKTFNINHLNLRRNGDN